MGTIQINEEIDLKTLVSFNRSYTNSLPELKNYLRESSGKQVKIILTRMIKEKPVYKVITGTITNVSEKSFCLTSNSDFFSQYDFEKTTLVHFDNLLGDVPMSFSDKIRSPFCFKANRLKSYMTVLSTMKKKMQECEGKKHSATLTFIQDGHKKKIECEILKVNRSNIEFHHLKTEKSSQIDLIPGTRHEKFLTPMQYLFGIHIIHGVENKINPYDDED